MNLSHTTLSQATNDNVIWIAQKKIWTFKGSNSCSRHKKEKKRKIHNLVVVSIPLLDSDDVYQSQMNVPFRRKDVLQLSSFWRARSNQGWFGNKEKY